MLLLLSAKNVYACAMTAVVGNGTTMLNHQQAYRNEASWLKGTSGTNNDAWGACYYHASGYAQHHYQLLPLDNIPIPSMGDHYYRSPTNIGGSAYPGIADYAHWAQFSEGKILFAHARRASSGEPAGAFAPFIYHSEAENIDYSFAHHGKVTKLSFINEFPGFADFLIGYDYAHNTNYFTSPNSNVDSAYLFLWIMQNVIENNGDVRLGLAAALQETASQDSCQINIFMSDGNGIYAYTNGVGQNNNYRMGYNSNTSNNGLSYLVRSWGTDVTSWSNYTTINPHHLYYFPAQGDIDVTYNIDTNLARFDIKEGLNWICFPVLSSAAGSDPDYTLQDINQYANTLQTKNGTVLQPLWDCSPTTHIWDEDAIISRTNGYILDMDDTYADYEYLTFGQKTAYNTAFNLYQNNENWVPYFIEQSQNPAIAFGNNISHVTAIYAQDWYIYKFKGKWYGAMQAGATGTLDYGKMYKVYVDQNISNFTWTVFGQSQPYVKEATSYFQYEEKPEYQAIVIESISDNPVFDEIGVFKSGECVGALKYQGYPINLQVYDDSSPDEYEYLLYFESKHDSIAQRKYASAAIDIDNKVVNNGRQIFSVINLSGGQEIDAPTPPALTAMIYPNPMRGNTNIEIKSNVKSAVEICIYNLKGQMVRNIESSELAKGKTSFVWDGKTDDGRTVSQGIYFCKIKSPNNVLTKKLIVIE